MMMMRPEAEGAACGLEGGWLRVLAEGGSLRKARYYCDIAWVWVAVRLLRPNFAENERCWCSD
jgi:hypothetical protein